MSVPSAHHTALDIISVKATSGPPPAIAEVTSQGTVITTPWRHPKIHGEIPALDVHLIGTYYGAPSPRVWRNGRMRLAGTGRPGAVGIVPAQHWGRWDIEAAAPLSYVLLSDARLQAFAGENSARGGAVRLVPRVGEPDPVGAHIMRALSRQAAQADQGDGVLIEQMLDLLCSHLLRVHSTRGGSLASMPQRGLLPWQVRRVTAYMRDRMDRDVTLAELAGLLKLSRFHFCTAFRLATEIGRAHV